MVPTYNERQSLRAFFAVAVLRSQVLDSERDDNFGERERRMPSIDEPELIFSDDDQVLTS